MKNTIFSALLAALSMQAIAQGTLYFCKSIFIDQFRFAVETYF